MSDTGSGAQSLDFSGFHDLGAMRLCHRAVVLGALARGEGGGVGFCGGRASCAEGSTASTVHNSHNESDPIRQ